MKLANIRLLGRYTNPATGKPFNIYKGRRVGYGTDYRFYLYRQRRVFVDEAEFFATWKLNQGPTQ